jgi:hypothetical protein
VAYDEQLAARLRDLLDGERGLTEQAMFGGLAFLVNGNMAVAASANGGLLLRCDPDRTDEMIATDGVARMEMRGQPMGGWLRVAPDVVDTDASLGHWVGVGVSYARSLPPK